MATLVRHAMTEDPKMLGPARSAADAAAVMARHGIGAVLVGDDEGLLGLVTDRDIVVRAVAEGLDPASVPLSEIASVDLVVVSPDMSLGDAEAIMAEYQVRRLPVLKGDDVVGVISLGDLALAVASKRTVGQTLEVVSTSEQTAALNDGPARGTPSRLKG